jgi:hypothetical protein
MLLLTFAAVLSLSQADQVQPSLQLSGRSFIIRQNARVLRVSSDIVKVPRPERVVYRKNSSFAVWDSRGLTIRKAGKVRTTRLPDIALTPKLFTREEIVQTKKLIASGERTKEVSALSGSKRVGDDVFFLARWDTRGGKAWLEALVRVSLTSPGLESQLLGRFEGVSAANGKIADELFLAPSQLIVLAQKADRSWGIGSFDVSAHSFAFKPVSRNLLGDWRLNTSAILAEETTDYGSKTLARVDLSTGTRRVVAEFQGAASVLQPEKPLIVRFSISQGDFLRNLDTSSELRLPKSSLAKVVNNQLLIWPASEREKAALFEPVRWFRVASASPVDANGSEPASRSSRSRTRRRQSAPPESRRGQ